MTQHTFAAQLSVDRRVDLWWLCFQVLNNIEMDGVIVIGEGEKDEVGCSGKACDRYGKGVGAIARSGKPDMLAMMAGTHAVLR